MSLHCYSPALWRMGHYEPDPNGVLRRVAMTYADELLGVASWRQATAVARLRRYAPKSSSTLPSFPGSASRSNAAAASSAGKTRSTSGAIRPLAR